MGDKPKYHYRFEYQTLFGHEFTEFVATDDDEANRIFWATRNPELNRLFVTVRSPCYEESDDGADGGDEHCPANRADSSEEHFAQEVLPGGCDVELFPVTNNPFVTCCADGHSGRRRIRTRIEDFLAVHFRKHH